MKLCQLFLYFLFIGASCTAFSAVTTFEKPFLVAGLEEEVQHLADMAGMPQEKAVLVLPSTVFVNTKKMVWLRFNEGFGKKFDFFLPHPRSLFSAAANETFPQTHMAAVLLQLFPAATGHAEFTPNTQPNDPVANLKPERIGQLIRLIDDVTPRYNPATPLRWRLNLEEKIYDILTRKDQPLVEDIDPYDFYREYAAVVIAKRLRKMFSEADLDEGDPQDMAAKTAMESDRPFTNISKLDDADFFDTSPWEEGELEELDARAWPYSKRQEYALKKEYFINLLVSAIEYQALQGTESSIQEALSVYFYAKRPTKASVGNFYAGYFGWDHIQLRSLRYPEVFSVVDYDAYRTAASRFPEEMHFLNLPYDFALNIAYFHTWSGAFYPTHYGSIKPLEHPSYSGCVEESVINMLRFLARTRDGRSIKYSNDTFPAGSHAHEFIERFGETYADDQTAGRLFLAEALRGAPEVILKKAGGYEVRSGIISGVNALRHLLGMPRAPLEFDAVEASLRTHLDSITHMLPAGTVLTVDPDMDKNGTTGEFYGNIYVTNSLEEELKWKLNKGHGFAEVPTSEGDSWLEDLTGAILNPSQVRNLSLFITNKALFDIAANNLRAEDHLNLYRTVDHTNPEIIASIVAHIARRMIIGDHRNSRFMKYFGHHLIELGDFHAKEITYKDLSSLILHPDIDDTIKENIISEFNFVLMGLSQEENLVLRWAAENRKTRFFAAAEYEKRTIPFYMDETSIKNHAEFLAENVGILPVYQLISHMEDPDLDTESIRTVMAGMPDTVRYLNLKGTTKQYLAVTESLLAFPEVKELTIGFIGGTPFDEKRDFILSVLGRNPDIKIDPENTLNGKEAEDLEPILTGAGFRPRPYPATWKPLEGELPADESEGAAGYAAAAAAAGEPLDAEEGAGAAAAGGRGAFAEARRTGEEDAADLRGALGRPMHAAAAAAAGGMEDF